MFTKLDSSCHFVVDPNGNRPLIDYYWMMDRKSFKPVHPMIKDGIRKRIELVQDSSAKANSFSVQINDLKELQTDLKSFRMEISAARTSSGDCHAHAFVTLGPSDLNRTLQLEKIISRSKKTFLPPFRKIESITLEGKDIKSGALTKRTYQGRS
jgi:hypothetical protein